MSVLDLLIQLQDATQHTCQCLHVVDNQLGLLVVYELVVPGSSLVPDTPQLDSSISVSGR